MFDRFAVIFQYNVTARKACRLCRGIINNFINEGAFRPGNVERPCQVGVQVLDNGAQPAVPWRGFFLNFNGFIIRFGLFRLQRYAWCILRVVRVTRHSTAQRRPQ